MFGGVFNRWPGRLVTLVHGGARAAPLALAALSRTLSRAEPMRMNLAPAVCELSQARLEATKLRQQTSTGHGRNFSLRTHPAAHPQEDHLRFLAKTLLPVFLNRRCRRFHCSAPLRSTVDFRITRSHQPKRRSGIQSIVTSPFRPCRRADLDLVTLLST